MSQNTRAGRGERAASAAPQTNAARPTTSLPACQQPLPGVPRPACRLAPRQLVRKPPPRPMSGLTFSCPLGTDRRRHLRRRHCRLLPSSTRVGVTQLAVGHPSGRQLVLSVNTQHRHVRRRHRRLLPASTRVGVTQLAVGHPSGRLLIFLTYLIFATMEWVASSMQQTFPGAGTSYHLPVLHAWTRLHQ